MASKGSPLASLSSPLAESVASVLEAGRTTGWTRAASELVSLLRCLRSPLEAVEGGVKRHELVAEAIRHQPQPARHLEPSLGLQRLAHPALALSVGLNIS